MSHNTTAVHVTHEAIGKIGGIGAVLEGLFTSQTYQSEIDRDILVCPLFTRDGDLKTRLGEDSEVLYSSIDGMVNTNYYSAFRSIEEAFNVNIIYGRRTFTDHRFGHSNSPEVILIDISCINKHPVDRLKESMFEQFGIRSDLYEHLWEFEQYVRLAPPALAVLKAIGAADNNDNTVIVSHEFMGMPTALASIVDPTCDFKTVFYAHEVAPVRPIVEENSGHDTMFYNAMKHAAENDMYVTDVFGSQNHNFKYALVEAARYCDNILAVGDYVIDELKFLAPEFSMADIDLTYNGIPAYEIDLEEKLQSKEKLRDYCSNLLGYRPDYTFTHVTRMTPSKGLWRDLRVLEHLDSHFQMENKTGVLFVLSTEIGKRSARDIYDMEAAYNWPVAHREGLPDLSGGEAAFHVGVQEFNARSRNIKVVYINQFGFSRDLCGHRMPFNMEFMDIRKGSDVEFGQSIYEPFGIAQLEPLSFGGICVVTNVCGCAGFADKVTGGKATKNVITVDYTDIGQSGECDIEDILQINKEVRNEIEFDISGQVARQLCETLPDNDAEMEALIKSGYEIAKHMSWDAVVDNYVMKSIRKAINKDHNKEIRLRA